MVANQFENINTALSLKCLFSTDAINSEARQYPRREGSRRQRTIRCYVDPIERTPIDGCIPDGVSILNSLHSAVEGRHAAVGGNASEHQKIRGRRPMVGKGQGPAIQIEINGLVPNE